MQLPKNPPIVIDTGRQLFVDNLLIAASTLRRIWHDPVKYSGNPVLRPETEWEINAGGNACSLPKGGGLWWDATTQEFKLWYEAGWLNKIALATSKDGINWTRPDLGILPGSNLIFNTDNPLYRPDSWSVVLDPNPPTPDEHYKMLFRHPEGAPRDIPAGFCAISPDGVHWEKIANLPPCGDRSSLFYDPFRGRWVYSMRSGWLAEGEKKARRNRMFYAVENFRDGADWLWNSSPDHMTLERWLYADDHDLPDPRIGDQPQLYNFDAVAYESLMLGCCEIWRGPENEICEEHGLPKITDLQWAFSRDGKNFFRPAERRNAIASERWGSGKWDTGYVQPVANLCVVMGDELWFYYGAFAGAPERRNTPEKKYDWSVNNGYYANGATGIAKLRRDGFCSLSAGREGGELITPVVRYSGEYLFVNFDAPDGGLRVEMLDPDGNVVPGYAAEDCQVLTGNSTCALVTWKNTRDLAARRWWRTARFRFILENGDLYSFWVSDTEKGESRGYLGGGGPGYAGLRDMPPARREIPAEIFAPRPEYAHENRFYEGIPSIAVSPKNGRLWRTWYGAKFGCEDIYDYCILQTSSDHGATWKDILICDPDGDGPRRTFDPELWIAPDGTLRWTWTDRVGDVAAPGDDDQLWMLTLNAEEEPDPARLPRPRRIATGVMMNKPVFLKDGTWLLPVAQWQHNPSACVYASTDNGQTFTRRGGAALPSALRTYDEHNVVEMADGTLRMFIRANNSGNAEQNCLLEAFSHDQGRTWTTPRFSRIAGLSSRCCVRKLRNGHWLLIKNGKYGEVPTSRARLVAMLSLDDGLTWDGGLLLDGREEVAYPDADECADGSIVITWDHARKQEREVLFAHVTEAEIIRGEFNK